MANFDATLDRERALAIRRRVSDNDVTNIGNEWRFRQITAPVDAGEMEVHFVGAGDEIAHVGDGAIHDELRWLFEADRTEIAGFTIKMLDDFSFSSEPEALVQPRNFAGLDLVQLMVAA